MKLAHTALRWLPRALTSAGLVAAAILSLVRPASADTANSCPAPATVVVFADNQSHDAMLELVLDGELRDPAATCAGPGDGAYAATLTCRGSGLVRCGALTGLRPGTWINRIAARAEGSAPQVQAQQAVFVAAAGTVSNVLVWTIYPRTFVVAAATEPELRSALDGAASFTAADPGSALVTFSRDAFPGAAAPQLIDLGFRLCPEDRRRAALCWSGSRIVLDALDARAERGGVILSVGKRAAPLVRVYGSDNVLRGLVLAGSTASDLLVQADTVAISGAAARRNRLERCLVQGPAKGDAVSVEAGAGQPSGGTPGDTVIDDCELTGASNKGLKVTTEARAIIRASCVHDNRNGGIQSILGGELVALHNLVQHNVPGSAQSGIAAGAAGDRGVRSILVTDGNIVRFSGARGLAAVDAADALIGNDYVADNQFAGARIESTTPDAVPAATLEGVALVCNHNGGITGTCRAALDDDGALCITDADCCTSGTGCCAGDPGCLTPPRCVPPAPQGFGAVLARCDGCPSPTVLLGDAAEPGRNALTLNVNSYPNAQGANLLHALPGVIVRAHGNQWEHCGPGATCDAAAIAAQDLMLATGAAVDLGTAAAARAGVPSLLAVSRGRPRAGDLVRVFGRDFDAIDGAACAQATSPLAPCSAENPRVAQQNRTSRYGNRVLLTIGDQTLPVDVHAVTPTMLAFYMPIDCFAPATLQVSKRGPDDVRRTATISFCDPGGCLGEPASTPCDDGSVCTLGDFCSGDGACVSGPVLDCGGPCMRCDPVLGCVPLPADTPCDDADACTVGDHCRGDAGVCVPGAPRVCQGQCLTGTCDPIRGCEPHPASAPCDDGNACTVSDHCRSDADVCVPGAPRACQGQCLTGTCDPARGCRPRGGTMSCEDGNACTRGDHCRGDADVCVAGPPPDCDDGDPCTMESCAPRVGCLHDPVQGFDAVTCRIARANSAIVRALGTQSPIARALERRLDHIEQATEQARAAHATGDLRKEHRRLNHVRSALIGLLRALRHRRRLPDGLAHELAAAVGEALDRVKQLRAGL